MKILLLNLASNRNSNNKRTQPQRVETPTTIHFLEKMRRNNRMRSELLLDLEEDSLWPIY